MRYSPILQKPRPKGEGLDVETSEESEQERDQDEGSPEGSDDDADDQASGDKSVPSPT